MKNFDPTSYLYSMSTQLASVFTSPLLVAGFDFLDPMWLLETFGLIGMIIIIFLESAFAPLPGDSLLFLGGVFAFKGTFNLWAVIIGCSIAAITGNQAGYWFGRKVGLALYNRPNSRIFTQDNLEKTHLYFEKYGAKTILIARLIPVVRGLAPIVAGVGKMNYRKFVTYNVVGGVLWATLIPLAGWKLGESIGAEAIDKFILPIVALIIIVSFIPLFVEYYKSRKNKGRDQETPVIDATDPTAKEIHTLVDD